MSEQANRIARQLGELPEPGYEILNCLCSFVRRFCVFPNEQCLTAVTLWIAHTHMVQHFYTTPRLALLSPEPSSGKTRVLEILDLLVARSMFVFNASPAAIFRSLAEEPKTLLFDECDAIWSSKGRDENHQDLRALINAGYKRGAQIPRCTGNNYEVRNFPAYCPVALAGLGELPDTIMTRSIVIKMRRRAPTENIEPFRLRRNRPEGEALNKRLQTWTAEVSEATGAAWPEMPQGVVDRNEEIWEPLIAVADSAGGDWPDKARQACSSLIKSAGERQMSLGIRLLADVRTVFRSQGVTRMGTAQLIECLIAGSDLLGDDAPWGELHGEGLNARKMASLLRPYDVRPKKLDFDGRKLNGYSIETLADAWNRYAPCPEEAEHAEPAEPHTARPGPIEPATDDSEAKVPVVPEVPDSADEEEVVRI